MLQVQRLTRGLQLLCLCLLLSVSLAPLAQAGFIDSYQLSAFTLTNTPNFQLNNGSVKMAGNSIVLTGGNSGSGEAGNADLVTKALVADMIQFMYSYSSLDIPNADSGGYLLNGLYFPLAVATGASGTVNFKVIAGDNFGFRVSSADNQFEPGILTISSVGAATTPEPATGSVMLLIGAGLVAAAGLRILRNARVETGA